MGAPSGDEALRFETRAIHAGQDPEPLYGAVNVPIYQTSTYAQDEVGAPKRWDYARAATPRGRRSRSRSPRWRAGTRAFAFASGMAAESTLLLTLRPGDHVVLADDVYGGTYRLLSRCSGRGVSRATPSTSPIWTRWRRSLRDDTRFVWVETPSNPMLKIVDIEAVTDVAHAAGARVVVDNTFATPALQRPLALGSDVVVHSVTKYLGGHSRPDRRRGGHERRRAGSSRSRFLMNAVGAVPGPMDCYLALRGLKTLAVRMRAHCEGAAAVAAFLATHPRVTRVHYPGLAAHPGHARRRPADAGFGGMVSFEVGDRAGGAGGGPATELFFLAESLGGVESLIEVPGPMTHASVAGSPLEVPDNLIRLSVGHRASRRPDRRSRPARSAEGGFREPRERTTLAPAWTTTQHDLVLILARDFASRLATAVFLVDTEDNLIYFNEAAEAMLGIPYAEGRWSRRPSGRGPSLRRMRTGAGTAPSERPLAWR